MLITKVKIVEEGRDYAQSSGGFWVLAMFHFLVSVVAPLVLILSLFVKVYICDLQTFWIYII